MTNPSILTPSIAMHQALLNMLEVYLHDETALRAVHTLMEILAMQQEKLAEDMTQMSATDPNFPIHYAAAQAAYDYINTFWQTLHKALPENQHKDNRNVR